MDIRGEVTKKVGEEERCDLLFGDRGESVSEKVEYLCTVVDF